MSDQDGSSGLGDDPAIWENSPIGSLTRWPESLRAYFLTISSLPHPSSIFWGEEQLLLQNKAWIDAKSSIKGQGMPQRDALSKPMREALQTIVESGISQELRAGPLFAELTSGNHNVSVAILSQLHPKGVLVQLIHHRSPQRPAEPRTNSNADWDVAQHKSIQARDTADEESERPGDRVPIDEHPFFRRFAELLPSGLAILDRDAKAMFVNRKFWDLTTLQEDEQFTSWPQSIHEEDYDRVMSAYRKAFSEQQELRIEFRAKDAPQPWRLLLLTPLGDEKSHHISNRDRGGFICSIVDISSEKSAEITERKAAQLARERKEQQERFIDMVSSDNGDLFNLQGLYSSIVQIS